MWGLHGSLVSMTQRHKHYRKFLCHWQSQVLQCVFPWLKQIAVLWKKTTSSSFIPKKRQESGFFCWCKAIKREGSSPVGLSENLKYWEGNCSLSQHGIAARSGRKTPNAGWHKHWNIHSIRSAPSAGYFFPFQSQEGDSLTILTSKAESLRGLTHWQGALNTFPCCIKLWGCTVWEIKGHEKAEI